ncbi:MAG: DNA repair exonuclease [Firmicutes bacterium]|nr:DNA repair exonuclease [Bacillota bacterium]
MIRFLHTADWQIGMKARHVAPVGDQVRAARFQTIRRLLQVAVERRADFVVVAGDVFEDNQVDNQLIHKLLSILESCPLPIYLLPGNHDPLTPDSVYWRPALTANCPANVKVLTTFDPLEPLPGVVLLPAPCYQKKSDLDPTSNWPLISSSGPKIGLAHGSLMIEGRYQADDYPIPVQAAQLRQLDYLALGHWHSLFSPDRRTFYSGTPEPTGFGETDSGKVLLVTFEGPDAIPQVEPIEVSTLVWEQWEYDLGIGIDELEGRLKQRAGQLAKPENTLLRLSLSGYSSPATAAKLTEISQWLKARLLHLDLVTDRLLAQPITAQLLNQARSQPFLQALLTDLQTTAAVLGEPLTEIPEDLAGEVEPDQQTLSALIEEGFLPADVREAMRQVAALVEEV